MAKHILLAFLAMLPLTVAHGTNLLFLGPGGHYDQSSGKSEVLSLHDQCGNVTRAFCRVPDYPLTDIEAYVAFVMEGYPQLCGGFVGSQEESQLSCYSLRDSAWVPATPMRSTRNHAAAATLKNGSVLVSGGYTAGGHYRSSSEMLTGSTWSPALELPSARYAHCMISLSTGEVFLHGGWSLGAVGMDTYLSTDLKNWQTKSSSLKTRVFHACAEVTLNTEQEVWVGSAGTTEIYSVATDTWRTGPAIPKTYKPNTNIPNKYPGEFISHNDQLYLAASYDNKGNKNVYQLKAGWTLEDAWQKVGETSSSRYHFQAMMISQDTCEGCARTNKQTFLRSLNVVKKVKTSSECQTRCAEYSGCTHFEWKKTKNVAERTCTLQKVGYKKKMDFVSGPISC